MAIMDARARLTALREHMRERNIGVYVVPSGDAHASEYLAPCDARRAWLTGFTGSAGLAVVTQTEALCWADGRYYLQAGQQLSSDWTLMKAGLPETPTWTAWLKELGPTTRVGVDPTTVSQKEAEPLGTALAKDPTRALVPIKENLVDLIWSDRPARPANPVFHLEEKYSGQSVADKLLGLRTKLDQIGSPGMVVSALDEIAWLFNLRGNDIPYNPVFFSYAIVTKHDCTLFANPASITPEVKEYLRKNHIVVLEYSQIWQALDSWKAQLTADRKAKEAKEAAEREAAVAAAQKGEAAPAKMPASEAAVAKNGETKDPKLVKSDKVLIGNTASWAIADALGKDNCEVRRSLIELAKAKKNATEMEGFRQCHIRDGAALCRYFAWLEELLAGGGKINEHDAACELEAFRKQNKLFMGLSFDTISSTGANAAIIHYKPDEENSAVIDPNQIYLCDSGAQYMDGTTDVTRTVHFGSPSEFEKRAFTRVLQGHIGLDVAVFPSGTNGYFIDCLARRALWADGLDYRHGTGHGVGHFLNVHEGPQSVSPRAPPDAVGLTEGMVISNEPGYYDDGKFGVRIESCVGIRNAQTPNNFGGNGYLEFENFTTVPIQTKMIDTALLSAAEREWVNAYHRDVYDKVKPELEAHGDKRALAWLERECKEI